MIPFTTSWRATTLFKAFILNAIAGAAIAALAIAARDATESVLIKHYFMSAYGVQEIHYYYKISFVFFSTLIGAIIVYNLLYIFLAFGGGQLAPKKLTNRKYI